MDMKLKGHLIKKSRLARAWSQSQLAAVTDLSLRTIQRVEKEGIASLETVKSLAAVFALDIDQIVQPKSTTARWTVASLAVLLLTGVLFMLPATAEPIMLKVLMKTPSKVLADVQLLNAEGVASELHIDATLKLVFMTEKTTADEVLISVQFFQSQADEMVLVSNPSIVTGHQQVASIEFDDFRLEIMPDY